MTTRADRFESPLPQFEDSAGVPYSGAQLFFYQSETDTKLNTYSNAGLTIANENPIVLDSFGRVPNAVFLQAAAYKVILAPADDTDPPTSPYWTQDPVYGAQYSTTAQFLSGDGSPNGTVAGSAGSATIPASVYWDFANRLLYVCTTTGTASTAVWTAINASTAAAVVPPPQGYLTLTSGVPIIPGDVTAATAVYYTPYVGLLVPIYNGTSFIPTSIVSELQLTLTSSYVASNIYDFYVFLLNGTPTLGTGPSWSAGTSGSITAGTCARGTGTGGAALTRLQGILTNTVSMTMRYGDGTTTTTVNANQGTYVGSLLMDGTNGQVSCYRSYTQTPKWGIWNAYNRTPIILQGGDGTATWTYNTATYRPSNNEPLNKCTVFCGLAEEEVRILFQQAASQDTSSSTVQNGIGVNSTTVASGFNPTIYHATTGGGSAGLLTNAEYVAAPALGINNYQMLEKGGAGPGNTNWLGTNVDMLMTAVYRG